MTIQKPKYAGEIHVVKCVCKNRINASLDFEFEVFSIIDKSIVNTPANNTEEESDDSGAIISSVARCPNCKQLLKIVEVGEAIPIESTESEIETTDSIKKHLPSHVVSFFKDFNLSLAHWQKIAFIYTILKPWESTDWNKLKVDPTNSVVVYSNVSKEGVLTAKRAFFNNQHQIMIKNINHATSISIT